MANYAISNVPRRVVYAASGTGPYAFTFEVLSASDIAVYKGDTLLTLTTDYTVTINANGTGSVTLTTSAGTSNITIVGSKGIQRTTDFTTGGDFFANTLNDELDAQTIFIQQVAETAERGLKAPVTDPTDINMTLPRKASRAGKTLAFDANGNPVVGEDIGNWRGDWAAGTAYTVRDLVRDASNSNVYRCNTAHTSSGTTPISSNADSAKWDLVVDAASAGTSATNAANSATAAAASASAASTSATNASTSATNAASSASAASTSATNASNSASSASTQATNAANSATLASDWASKTNGQVASTDYSAKAWSIGGTGVSNTASAGAAKEWATKTGGTVDGTEFSAKKYATDAASSASSASSSASTATTQASNASTSASNAASSASAASTSASQAATSATNASNSASAASTSASNAATSATNASNSASAAATSATNAAASFDSFDDRYLGAKSSNPTTDNDGDALLTGALHFNTTAGEMRIWNGTAWVAATVSPDTISERNFTATAGQTSYTFTGGYRVGYVYVWVNGVLLDSADIVATNGTTITFNSALALNDEVRLLTFKAVGSVTIGDITGLQTALDGKVAKAGDTMTGALGVVAGTVSAPGVFASGDTNTGLFFPAADTIAFAEGGVEAMRLDSSGNVGIGTSSPAGVVGSGRTLALYNTSNATLSIQAVDGGNDRNATLELLSSGNGASTADIVYGDTDTTPGTPSPLRFLGRHSGVTTERMRITSGGNVGIGTNSPVAPANTTALTIYNASESRIALQNSTSGTLETDGVSLAINGSDFYITNREAGNLLFFNNGSERMRITSGGDVGIGTNSPGQRLQISNTSSSGYAAIRMAASSRTYDVGVAGSATGFQQNNWYIYDVTAAATRLVIDSSGRVTMPSQPAFRAYHSGDINWNGSVTPIVYNTALFNTGNHYNTSTGVFTAPIAGTYLFAVHTMFMDEATYNFIFLGVQVNSTTKAEFMRQGVKANYDTFGNSIILSLSANDAVRIILSTDGTNAGYMRGGEPMNSFMGYLLG